MRQVQPAASVSTCVSTVVRHGSSLVYRVCMPGCSPRHRAAAASAGSLMLTAVTFCLGMDTLTPAQPFGIGRLMVAVDGCERLRSLQLINCGLRRLPGSLTPQAAGVAEPGVQPPPVPRWPVGQLRGAVKVQISRHTD